MKSEKMSRRDERKKVTVHTRHSQKRIFDAFRCFADLLSYDNKRFAQIALRRIGILSLT